VATPANKLPTHSALLGAGYSVVVADGFAALTVRRVAATANANLGSFVYHFGTRDRFVRELIEQWYAPVLAEMTVVVDSAAGPVDRLRRAILQLVDFSAKQDVFLGRLLMAAAAGDAPAREFLGSMSKRHPRLLIRLIRIAQAEGALVREQPLQVLMFLMASVGLPRLLATAWQGPPLFGKSLSATLHRMACDRLRIAQRLDWAIRGLTREQSK
jgi:AcrR family transcriptional regulator